MIVAPVLVWLVAVPEPWGYLGDEVPPGQLWYVLSKLAGLIGVSSLSLQLSCVFIGKGFPNGFLKHFGRGYHYRLGSITATIILLHVVLFVSAVSVRTEHLAVHLLTPNLNGYYNSMVSLGALGFYLLLLLVVLGATLRLRWHKLKWVHMTLAWLTVVAVFVHSVAIGSETNHWVVRLFYLSLLMSLVASIVIWLLNHRVVQRKR